MGKVNQSLTNSLADPSHGGYVGAVNVNTNPGSSAASGGIGKSGDYFYGDPSFFFKVGTKWIAFEEGSVTEL